MYVCVLSHLSYVWHFATPWTVAHQVPLSTGFSRQEYWSGLPVPFPGKLLNSGIEPAAPALQGDSWLLSHQGSPGTNKPVNNYSKLKWTKFSNQKTLNGWIGKKQDPLCVAYERLILDVKTHTDWQWKDEESIQCKRKPKESWSPILISENKL